MPTEDYLISIQTELQNDPALTKLTNSLNRASRAVGPAQRNIRAATKSTAAFGNAAQNASFQLTDFIVQVQGGQAASRAFAQQAPQLLAGFGALGAALGVVAAVLPSVIAGFSGGADAAASLDDQIKSLRENVDALGNTVSRVDFSSWIKDFNELDRQARTLATSILELRTQAAQIEFEAAIQSFTGFVDVIVPGTKLADIQLASIANNLGVSVGTLEQLIPLVEQFRADPFGDPANLESIVALLEQAGVAALPLLNRLNELKAAQEGLNAATQSAAQAREAGPTGQISTGMETLETVVPFGSEEMERYIKLSPVYRAYLKEQADLVNEFAEAQRIAADQSNNNVEVWEASAAIIQDVSQSIESSFAGVINGTKSVSEAFEDMAKQIVAQLLKIAAQAAITGIFGPNFLGGAFTPGAAQGATVNRGRVVPMARGGIVNSPTVFPMARGAGLMGEAGPEAILPLRRTGSGNLGVESSPVNVTINNLAPGVSVRQRPGESGLTIDVVMDTLASQIRRGGNSVATAMEDTYSIGRGRAVY